MRLPRGEIGLIIGDVDCVDNPLKVTCFFPDGLHIGSLGWTEFTGKSKMSSIKARRRRQLLGHDKFHRGIAAIGVH